VRVRSRDELAAQLNVPVLAAVPARGGTPLSIEQFAESFRLLRTNLRVQHEPSSIGAIAVTSWEQGEGKTTVVSELAISLAASGTETLVVDADGDGKPARSLLVSNAADRLEPGLTEYALGRAELGEAIHETRFSSMRLMPRGRSVPSLSSVLETRHGRGVFDRLRDEGRAVVVDCPALTRGADAPTIATRVAGVVLVVDLSRATVPALRNAMRRLEAVNARVLGVVVNRDRVDAPVGHEPHRPAGSNGAGGVRDGVGEHTRRLLSRR
jgi:capsular exopolysaccharide synthesis family protein